MDVREVLTDRSTIIYIILEALHRTPGGNLSRVDVYGHVTQTRVIRFDMFERIVGIAQGIGWIEPGAGAVLQITADGHRLMKDVEHAIKVQP